MSFFLVFCSPRVISWPSCVGPRPKFPFKIHIHTAAREGSSANDGGMSLVACRSACPGGRVTGSLGSGPGRRCMHGGLSRCAGTISGCSISAPLFALHRLIRRFHQSSNSYGPTTRYPYCCCCCCCYCDERRATSDGNWAASGSGQTPLVSWDHFDRFLEHGSLDHNRLAESAIQRHRKQIPSGRQSTRRVPAMSA